MVPHEPDDWTEHRTFLSVGGGLGWLGNDARSARAVSLQLGYRLSPVLSLIVDAQLVRRHQASLVPGELSGITAATVGLRYEGRWLYMKAGLGFGELSHAGGEGRDFMRATRSQLLPAATAGIGLKLIDTERWRLAVELTSTLVKGPGGIELASSAGVMFEYRW